MSIFLKRVRSQFNVLILFFILSLGSYGCKTTNPSMGTSSGHTVTGAAAGEASQGHNTSLESCLSPLGTISVFENKNEPWWHYYHSRYNHLGSTIPVIRTMIQQSNCFVVVERGRAMDAMTEERQLMASGELREGSNFGKGQMVAADYTVSPSIQFSEKGTGGVGAAAGGLLGRLPGVSGVAGSLVGGAAGGLKRNEAATTLLLVDNRSGVQVSSSVGNAQNFDFGLLGGLSGSLGAAGAGGFSNTPEGKVIVAAFADSYNNMVRALRNYKAQDVEGGLGKGGKLEVK